MKAAWVAVFVVLTLSPVIAQNPQPEKPALATPSLSANDLAAKVPTPKADDVKSIDAIMHAIYSAISGPAGSRNWDRFRSLFLTTARFTDTGKKPDGPIVVHTWSVDDFVHDAGLVFAQEGFYENGIVNKTETFGNVAQVFSSYESRHAPGEKPFARGINSVQLMNDGKRWWVVSILWDAERPDNPLPKAFTAKH